jgi:4-diphosphocytidyl-2-C-methyl-D-erythritol kinase
MTPESMSGRAPAKINLTLEVTGRRADGYHSLATIIQTLALSDQVSIGLGGTASRLTTSGPFAAGTPADESNLAWRAALELADLTGNSFDSLTISIEKQIPPAGGLGGGASDAATTLRLLQPLWGATGDQVLAAANAVGSDEAALVLGGRVLATGRGDVVRALPDGPVLGVVLFVSSIQLEDKTGRLFEALDTLPFDSDDATSAALRHRRRAWTGGDIYNSFEKVAFHVFPGLDRLQADLEARLEAAVRLAGAGPTLIWVGPLAERDEAASRAGGADCLVIPTSTEASLWRRS